MRGFVRVPSLATVLVLISVSAFAQQGTSELRGRIVDQQNAAMPGVNVIARNEETGMFRESATPCSVRVTARYTPKS